MPDAKRVAAAVGKILRPLPDVDEVFVEYVLTSIEDGCTRDEIQELLEGVVEGRKDGRDLERRVLALVEEGQGEEDNAAAVPLKTLAAPVTAADFGLRAPAAPATAPAATAAVAQAPAPAADEAAEAAEELAEAEGPGPAAGRRQAKRKAKAKARAGAEEAWRPPAQEVVVTAKQTRFDASYGKNGYKSTALDGLDIEGIDISIGSRTLLSEAHLQLFPGRYGFIGPNGTGKTTLLRAMAKHQIPGYPSSLTILVEQEDVGDSKAPVDSVLGACEELWELRGEEQKLQEGLDNRSARLALLEVELGRKERARVAAELRSKQLSGQRGDAADQELLRAEHTVADARKELEAARAEAAPDPDLEAEAEVRCAELLEEVRSRLLSVDEGQLRAKATRILVGLGFTHEMLQSPTERLSGGWRMRVALAKALLLEPQVLLLDEPTNHLDWAGLLWLEQYLRTLENIILVVVSHDRAFLDQVCTRILRLYNRRLDVFEGNYSEYERQREEHKQHQAEMQERIQEKREKEMDKIQRMEREGRKANNENMLSQVASRRKKMGIGRDKTQAEAMRGCRVGLESTADGKRFIFHAGQTTGAEAVLEFEEPVSMTLKAAAPLGHHGPALQCRGLAVGHGDRRLVAPFDLDVNRGCRMAVLGLNGTGKTTLLSTVAQQLAPVRGDVFHDPRCVVGYFAQHQADALPLGSSALEHVRAASPGAAEATVRSHLASFGLRGDKVLQQLSSLSGGEKTRVALAAVTIKAPHVLLLDEPTNHLDLQTVEALGGALRAFEGGLVVVSHDRRLIGDLCQEHYVVADGSFKRIDNLAAFMKLAKRSAAQAA